MSKRTIRSSKNKADAIQNLQTEYDFSKLQAEAIVNLQLYRLTNTDVAVLKEEMEELQKKINVLRQILSNEEALKHVMKTEAKLIKKEYAVPRKTTINETITEVKVDEVDLITKEDCMVVVTKEGYVKRVSTRSYSASDDETGLKDKDYVLNLYEANTMDTLILFTSLGNFLYIPVYELPDVKWKDLGKHVSNIIKISSDEEIIGSYLTDDFKDVNFLTFTKNGMVKKSSLEDFKVQRYSKPINLMKLKAKDKVVSVSICEEEIFVVTKNGYGLRYLASEVPLTGLRGSGVKAINLKDDYLVSGFGFDKSLEYVTIFTSNQTAKRVRLNEFEKTSRARRGLLLLREVKTNPYKVLSTFILENKSYFSVKLEDSSFIEIKNTEIPILDRYKTGSVITKKALLEVFPIKDLEKVNLPKVEASKEDISQEKAHQISLLEIDQELKEIDNILK